jgi:hypothetical protein
MRGFLLGKIYMVEKIIRVKFEGMDATVPEEIQKRIRTGDADHVFVEKRKALTISGGSVPVRIREIELFDVELKGEEHVLYAAINHGEGAITRVVSVTGPTRKAALWRLGNSYNIASLRDDNKEHSFSSKNGHAGTSADGDYE